MAWINQVPRTEAGTAWVNIYVLLGPEQALWRRQAIRHGRRFGRAVIEVHTELKSVCTAH